MSRKNIVTNYAMFGSSGCDMSAASSTSNVTSVVNTDNIGIMATWTGSSPVGVLFIDASNDNTNWVTLDFGTSIAISGNSGNHMLNINQLPFSYLRARYTKTSGTGTLVCSLTTKQMGG